MSAPVCQQLARVQRVRPGSRALPNQKVAPASCRSRHCDPSRCVAASAKTADEKDVKAKVEEHHIEGIQSFVASIDDRAGHVPSEYFKNPLSDLFQYFDTDEDGFIDAQGIYAALKLKGIGITEEQVETFVKASDKNDDKRIDCSEFEHLVHQMADVDKNIYGLRID